MLAGIIARPRATSLADEFGSDFVRNCGAERFAGMCEWRDYSAQCVSVRRGEDYEVRAFPIRLIHPYASSFDPLRSVILADRDEFHFGRDDALSRVTELRNARQRFARKAALRAVDG